MTLNFGKLFVFSASDILPFINGLVVDDPLGSQPVRGSGSLKPSPLDSHGSAQGFLDVINLWRPVIVGDVEDEVLSVLCMA